MVDVSDEETFEQPVRHAPRESDWIAPPAGSPPVGLALPAPPDYYLNPHVNAFGFPPLVAHCLQILQIPPAALCAIDTTRDYEVASWRGRFIAAGLSEEDAETLEHVFLASASREQRDVLRVGSGVSCPSLPSTSRSARISMDTISSVSSLSNEE